jgi:hypothetical protein
MQIKNRPKVLALAAIAVVGLFAADALVFTPLTASWKARQGKIAELRKQIVDGTHLVEREQSIRGRWEQMRTNTLANNNSLAEQQLLKSIDQWSQGGRRLSVNSITPQWKRDNDDYSSLECRVDATGSVDSIRDFLYEVEKDALGVKLESVEVTARDKEGRQLALGLQLSGLVLNLQEKRP